MFRLLLAMVLFSLSACTASIKLDDTDHSKYVTNEKLQKVVSDIDAILIGFKRKIEEQGVKK